MRETYCYCWDRRADIFVRCMLLGIWRGTVYVLTAGGREEGFAEEAVVIL
jgi:hypothetical protein